MLKRLHAAVLHLHNGTFLERVQANWHDFRRRRRLARWQSQVDKLQDLKMIIEPGIRMWLYFDSELSKLIYCGDFEWQERQFLNAYLRPGDVFVDIGANIGIFSLVAAHCVGNSGHVYAFEPCSKTYLRLLTNVQLNNLANLSCYQLAVSDSVGQLDMTISLDGYDAWNSFGQPVAGKSFAIETVHSITWDDFAEGHHLLGRVRMMKIDVEGWETRVLFGGIKTLSRMDAPVLMVEFCDQTSQSAGGSCSRLYHTLEELGYHLFTYDLKSRRLIWDPLREAYPYLNLIAAKYPKQVATILGIVFAGAG